MQALTSADLLQLWEAGSEQTLIERSLLFLAKALPEQTPSSLAMLSIGERDEMLLCLREYLFGTKLKNTAACPKCADIVEWESNSRDMHLQPVPPLPANSVLEFVKDDLNIKYRLPNSTDLLRVIRNANSYIADPNKLLTDCIVDIQHNSEAIQVTNLDAETLQALEIQISNDDPQADIGMMLNCPACSNEWEAKFDILSYLWTEIDVWATHLLHEIYLLASAFGWAEKDILNMSPQRRTMYVKLIQA
jgi:Zn finger protein HypA/HybF involved in hydrogenase expression